MRRSLQRCVHGPRYVVQGMFFAVETLGVLVKWLCIRLLARREPQGNSFTVYTPGVRLHAKGCKTMSGQSLEEEVRGNGGRQGHGQLLRDDARPGYDAAALR